MFSTMLEKMISLMEKAGVVVEGDVGNMLKDIKDLIAHVEGNNSPAQAPAADEPITPAPADPAPVTAAPEVQDAAPSSSEPSTPTTDTAASS